MVKVSDKVKFDTFLFSVTCWRPAGNFLKTRDVNYKRLTGDVSAGLESYALTLRTDNTIQKSIAIYQ